MVGGLLDVNGMPVGEGVPATSVTRFTTLEYVLNLRFCAGFSLVCECPLLGKADITSGAAASKDA
jgi:hypothetical protein